MINRKLRSESREGCWWSCGKQKWVWKALRAVIDWRSNEEDYPEAVSLESFALKVETSFDRQEDKALVAEKRFQVKELKFFQSEWRNRNFLDR